MTEKKISTVHWRNTIGSPFRFSLDPRMLTKEGYKLETTATLKGQGYFMKSRVPVTIVFTEEYVIEYIALKVLRQLKPQKYNDFQKLVSKAWEYWKEHEKQQNSK